MDKERDLEDNQEYIVGLQKINKKGVKLIDSGSYKKIETFEGEDV